MRWLTQRTYEEGTRKLVDPTDKIMKVTMDVQQWEVNLLRFVQANFGEDRGLWLTTNVQVTQYPDTSIFAELGYGSAVADIVREKWEIIVSRMSRIEELLRENPEL